MSGILNLFHGKGDVALRIAIIFGGRDLTVDFVLKLRQVFHQMHLISILLNHQLLGLFLCVEFLKSGGQVDTLSVNRIGVSLHRLMFKFKHQYVLQVFLLNLALMTISLFSFEAVYIYSTIQARHVLSHLAFLKLRIMDGTIQDVSSVDSFLRNYNLGKTLGIGSFGKVKIAEHTLTGHKVAVKILNRKKIKNMDMEEKVRREIKILRLFMHPHIIRLYEVVETHSDIYVVMEYVKSGELFDYIVEKGRLHEEEARMFFQQIISGVEYCHRNMVVHRDLKPENLLLDSKHNVKIADFGLSNIMRDGHFLKTSCGSPNYAAPEGGIYTLPSHLSAGARDLIPRMLIVDPMKRMTIPEIRAHPWFQAHLPRYLAVPPPDTTQQAKKEVIKMGFDRTALVDSLRNRVQNEGTVTYYLLLDNRFRVSNGYLGAEFKETMEFGYNRNMSETVASPVGQRFPGVIDYQQFGGRQFPADRKWALGLQSRAHPREIMTEVLKALQELNVSWKKIGQYNMKCRWAPCSPSHHEGMLNNSMHDNNYFGDESAIIENDGNVRPQNVVKFEVQLYKTREDKYLLDLQRVQGPQFLFLDLCAAFLAQLRVL
ncbi:SNF1-related protein kinase catalytic subunit alpha KIN10 [Sesamum angolense]|uniref:non-specific serine/threonine protein kinase n=1 Tax=Sesamum angolense TaxID=2727404 RepID=A0AAE1WGP2_9LAMI|nr:SNF1-related protein kinase catalytic subunit alpha KIN10 [Sesamum angolense]